MELVAVVLHCKTSVDRFESAKALLNYGFSNYALVTPQPESGIPPVPVVLGRQESVTPVPEHSTPVLLEKALAAQVQTAIAVDGTGACGCRTADRHDDCHGGGAADCRNPACCAGGCRCPHIPGTLGRVFKTYLYVCVIYFCFGSDSALYFRPTRRDASVTLPREMAVMPNFPRSWSMAWSSLRARSFFSS